MIRSHGAALTAVGDGLVENVSAAKLYEATRSKARGLHWRNLRYAFRPEPIPSFRGTIETPAADRVGICCSGGGVRSAAFNLGALQALQGAGDELKRADYLAAVSGGSYIGAAFAMVAKCAQIDGDTADSNKELLERTPPFAPGSPEEQYLRNRCSYLAPTGMDKLYLAYRIVLGVMVNFVFLGLPLFGVALILGGTAYSAAFKHLAGTCNGGCSASPVPLYMWVVPVAVLAVSVMLGVWGLVARTLNDRWALFLQVWSTRLLLASAGLAWLTVGLPSVVGALSAGSSTGTSGGTSGIVGLGGLAGVLAGVAAQLREAVATPSSAVDEAKKVRKWLVSLSSVARRWVAYAVGAFVGPGLLLGAMVLGAALALRHSPRGSVNLWYALVGLGAIATFAGAYRVADLTSWSLHPFYKRRLCTAFALKRVKPSELGPRDDGRPLNCIPQDEIHGIAVERDFDTPIRLSETAVDDWPALLVCAAANVSDPGATPPGRGVTSFTFSAKEMGGPLVGGVPTLVYETALIGQERNAREPPETAPTKRVRNCTLPAAMAMSGAALSPSMGKMTRRPLTFLMALANIRLGVWVPNPRWVAGLSGWGRDAGRNTDSDGAEERRNEEQRPNPKELRFARPRPSYLIRELLGRNRIDAKYLYVTDGGHYENLGLVELLRRGCMEIYCFDASGGQNCKELGDAIALARSELGVQIKIDPSPMRPSNSDGIAPKNAVTGSFRYIPDGPKGTLIYARNVMSADSPWDVKAYHQVDPRFPSDPTIDQLYTDQRFEAYRQLGVGAGCRAAKLMQKARGAGAVESGHETDGGG